MYHDGTAVFLVAEALLEAESNPHVVHRRHGRVLGGILGVEIGPDDRPSLGFLPTGTANVAGPAFGFPTDPDRSASVLAASEGRPGDVGVATTADESSDMSAQPAE